MKYILKCAILAIIISVSAFMLSVCQSTNIEGKKMGIDEIIKKEMLFDGIKDKVEKSNVQNVILNKNIKGLIINLGREEFKGILDPNELVLGKPFKVYAENEEIVKSLFEKKDVGKVLKEIPYEWHVPVFCKRDNLKQKPKQAINEILDDKQLEEYVVGTTYSLSQQGVKKEWNVKKVGGRLDPQQIDFCRKSDLLNSLLQKNGIGKLNMVSNIELTSIHMNIIYFKNDQKEYAIPLIHARKELYGVENMKVYELDKFVATVKSKLSAQK